MADGAERVGQSEGPVAPTYAVAVFGAAKISTRHGPYGNGQGGACAVYCLNFLGIVVVVITIKSIN